MQWQPRQSLLFSLSSLGREGSPAAAAAASVLASGRTLANCALHRATITTSRAEEQINSEAPGDPAGQLGTAIRGRRPSTGRSAAGIKS